MTDWRPKDAGPGPHKASSPEQYQAAENAYTLAGSFWRALAADDDEAFRAIVLSTTLARFVDPGSGPAARFREALGLTREQCGSIGLSNCVRADSAGAFVVLCMELRTLGTERIPEPGQLRNAWPVVVVSAEGGWRVRGVTDASMASATVALIDVVPPSDLPTA